MARYIEGVGYSKQSDKFKGKYTKDQFRGMRAMKGKRAAGDKLMGRKGVDKMEDLSKGERRRFSKNNPVSFIGDARDKGKQYYDDGKLKNVTNKNNPFANLDDYTGREFGRRAAAGEDLLTTGDLEGLKNVGKHSKGDILAYADKTDARISGSAQAMLDRWKSAIMEAEKPNNNPGPPGTAPGIDEVNNIEAVQGDDGMFDIADVPQYQGDRTANDNRFDDASAQNLGDDNIIMPKNMEATDTGDIDIFGDNWGIVNTGNLDNSLNFTYNGDSATSGYRPFTGDAAGYTALGEYFYDQNSGLQEAGKITNAFMGNSRNPVNSAGLRDQADRTPSQFFDIGNQFQAGIFGSGRNIAYDGEWMPPGEPEDLSLEEQIERLKSATYS